MQNSTLHKGDPSSYLQSMPDGGLGIGTKNVDPAASMLKLALGCGLWKKRVDVGYRSLMVRGYDPSEAGG